MQKKYAYIDCFEDLKEIPFRNPLMRYLGDKALKKHMIKKFPNTIEDISYINSAGYYIKLPIIKSKICEEEDYIRHIIQTFNQQLIQYDIDILILDNSLKKYQDQFSAPVAKGNVLGLLYIEYILEDIKKEIKKPKKELHYLIIDGPSTDCDYVLDHVTQDMNALTLVTEQPKRYEEKLQEIYDEHGLAVQVKGKSLRQELEGDIILQCNTLSDKLFYCYQEHGILVDFLSSEETLAQIKLKRQDLEIFCKFDISFQEIHWNSDLLLGIMINNDRFLKNMYLNGYRYPNKDKIDKVLRKYPITIEVRRL